MVRTGVETFQGQLTSKTFNAHPKIDPVTGELINIGYEAKGDGTNDISYFVFDKNGKKTEECWFKAPFVCMTHDIGVTENWIVVILPPLVYVPDELQKQGHSHFAWDATTPMTFGMFPRRSPKPEDIRWFTYEPAFGVHAGNAYEDANGIVCLDMPIANWNRVRTFSCHSGLLWLITPRCSTSQHWMKRDEEYQSIARDTCDFTSILEAPPHTWTGRSWSISWASSLPLIIVLPRSHIATLF